MLSVLAPQNAPVLFSSLLTPHSSLLFYSITHVSLLPPPWLELTTSEPLVRAVRVRPPGRTQVDLPVTIYGRKSTWRGAGPSSVQVGQVDKVTTGWAM